MSNDYTKILFDTYTHHHLRDMIINISPYEVSIFSVIKTYEQTRWIDSIKSCHQFFIDWYKDMLEYPEVYELPVDKYPSEAMQLDRNIREYLAISKIKNLNLKYLLKHHALKKKARSAIYFICDFMLSLGELGELRGNNLYIDLKERSEIGVKYTNLMRDVKFITFLKRMGFAYDVQEEQIILSNDKYPDMFFAYYYLCKICASNKKIRFLFYRCDFRALDTTFKWALNDIIRVAPERDKNFLLDIDGFMKVLKYKTVIEFENRYAYTLKQGVIFRVEFEGDRYHLYFRWPLKENLSYKVFEKLSVLSPELSKEVFNNLLPCRPDCNPGYGAKDSKHCGARVMIERENEHRYICIDSGLPIWEHSKENFENIKIMARIIREVFDEID